MNRTYTLHKGIGNAFTFLFILLPLFIFSQKNGTLKGNIIDATSNAPLEYATISIFSQKDSTIVTGDISDAKGNYNIAIPYGDYFGKIEFIAYHSQEIAAFSLSSKNKKVDLGTIKLAVNTTSLKEVQVLTAKGETQISLDKRVYNVGKDLSATGGNATDILDNVPSVAVEDDGKITLRGNSSVQILIDGKPSILTSGKGSLQQLPASMIDRIEVITNPSAKYEAEGTAGIINIVLRKEHKTGVNGSVGLTVGYPDIYGVNANLNTRKNKFNFFTNISLSYQKTHGEGKLYQESKSDVLEIMEFSRAHVMGGLWGDVRLGVDYYFDKNNTLTTSIFYEKGEDRDEINMEYVDYIGNLDNRVAILTRDDHTTKKEDNLEYALTYTRNFGSKGHELVGDIRFQNNETLDQSDLLGKFFTPDYQPSGVKDLLQRSGGLEGERRLITKLDYVYPIGKGKKLELGYQGSFRNIKNDFLVEEFDDVNWNVLENVSNDFKYDEKIIGIYGTYKNKIKNFSYQIGARVEHTDIATELVNTQETNPRIYTNFFPSANIGYQLPKDNSIKLSYSRRVRRPTFNDLNPFFTYNDPRSRFQGNPDLNPEFADSYELAHVKYWDKGSFSSAIFYRHRTDVIRRILHTVSGDTTLLRPENLVSQDDIGLDFTASYKPLSWWSVNGNAVIYHVSNNATNIGQAFESDGYAWRGRISTKVKFKKRNEFQIKLNYQSERVIAQGIVLPLAYLNAGFSRHFWNKKGKLTISVSDIFNSRVGKAQKTTSSIYRETEFLWSRRTTRLTFNYRL